MNFQLALAEDHVLLQTIANVMMAGLALIVLLQHVSTLVPHLQMFALDTANVLQKTSVSVIQVSQAQNVKIQSAIIGQLMILLYALLMETVQLQIIAFVK